MTTLALTAVGRTRGETGVALAANLLLAVVLAGKNLERGLNDTTTETRVYRRKCVSNLFPAPSPTRIS